MPLLDEEFYVLLDENNRIITYEDTYTGEESKGLYRLNEIERVKDSASHCVGYPNVSGGVTFKKVKILVL